MALKEHHCPDRDGASKFKHDLGGYYSDMKPEHTDTRAHSAIVLEVYGETIEFPRYYCIHPLMNPGYCIHSQSDTQ